MSIGAGVRAVHGRCAHAGHWGGAGGLATSYWLTQAGVEHLLVERRDRLGGGWMDNCRDSFCLVAANFSIQLPRHMPTPALTRTVSCPDQRPEEGPPSGHHPACRPGARGHVFVLVAVTETETLRWVLAGTGERGCDECPG